MNRAVLALLALLVLPGPPAQAGPPSDPEVLRGAGIEVRTTAELFRQARTLFDTLTVADLREAYVAQGIAAPWSEAVETTPLGEVAFLGSYTLAESFLNPDAPPPRADTRPGKYLRFLARSHVRRLGYNERSLTGRRLFQGALRWYWSDALIEYSPLQLFTIEDRKGGCVGYLGVRAWQQPGSNDHLLLPCREGSRSLHAPFAELLRKAHALPAARDELMVLPTRPWQWRTLPGCTNAAQEVRGIFRSDGVFLVPLGSRNVYELDAGAHNLFAAFPLRITVNYPVSGEGRSRIAIVSAVHFSQRYCDPAAR